MVWLQFFLHRVFGYRGVVLFPWMAQVYDREAESGNSALVTVLHLTHTVTFFLSCVDNIFKCLFGTIQDNRISNLSE